MNPQSDERLQRYIDTATVLIADWRALSKLSTGQAEAKVWARCAGELEANVQALKGQS